MNTKKLFAILLAVLMVFSLAACGNGEPAETTDTTAATTEATTKATTAATEATEPDDGKYCYVAGTIVEANGAAYYADNEAVYTFTKGEPELVCNADLDADAVLVTDGYTLFFADKEGNVTMLDLTAKTGKVLCQVDAGCKVAAADQKYVYIQTAAGGVEAMPSVEKFAIADGKSVEKIDTVICGCAGRVTYLADYISDVSEFNASFYNTEGELIQTLENCQSISTKNNLITLAVTDAPEDVKSLTLKCAYNGEIQDLVSMDLTEGSSFLSVSMNGTIAQLNSTDKDNQFEKVIIDLRRVEMADSESAYMQSEVNGAWGFVHNSVEYLVAYDALYTCVHNKLDKVAAFPEEYCGSTVVVMGGQALVDSPVNNTLFIDLP